MTDQKHTDVCAQLCVFCRKGEDPTLCIDTHYRHYLGDNKGIICPAEGVWAAVTAEDKKDTEDA